MWFLLSSCAAACIVDPRPCETLSLRVSYTYETTCRAVAKQIKGKYSLQLPQGRLSQKQVSEQLKKQSREQGVFVEEVVLVWDPPSCIGPDSPQPKKAVGIERLVLEPDSDTGVQQLLVCTPIDDKAEKTLERDFLLACRRGNSRNVDCTLQLKH